MLNIKDENYLLECIILSYGNFNTTTKECLNSLLPQANFLQIPITVVDNGSLDDTPDLLRSNNFNTNYRTLYLPENLGFAGGMNYGVSQSKAEWVLLVGSDTQFHPHALERVVEVVKNAKSNWGIICPLTNDAGTAQRLILQSKSPKDMYEEFDEINLGGNFKEVVELYRADFFCVAIRKSLWEMLQGLDMSYGRGYYEDFDFCMRAKALGFSIVMSENVFVYHEGSATFKLQNNQKTLLRKNKKIFIKRFPKAELRHRRFDNLQILLNYLETPVQELSESCINLMKFRLKMLRQDEPRSLWKKELWRTKVRKIKKRIQQEGIQI